MIVIVDTNILVSLFRENPVRHIIINANLYDLKLLTPEYALEELRNNIKTLLRYTKYRTEQDLEHIFIILEQVIEVKKMEYYQECREKAAEICPDPKDTLFFALALKTNGTIWSKTLNSKDKHILKSIPQKRS